jgi:hypothetical protein
MANAAIVKDAWTTLTITNIAVANDTTDPFVAWQSARISGLSDRRLDCEVFLDIVTANTARAADATAYVFLVPWVTTDGGTTWIPGANFGTTTLPTGAEGTAVITEPNSLRPAVPLPYKDTQQRLQGSFSIYSVLGWMPDAWSIAIRNATGAALVESGSVIGYRWITTSI